jgi:hypothetical protein
MRWLGLFCLLTFAFLSANIFAANTNGTALSGILSGSVATKPKSNPMDLGAQKVMQELHIVTNGSTSSSSPPPIDCGNGVVIRQAITNSTTVLTPYQASSGSSTWYYLCSVAVSNYDLTHNARIMAELSAYNTINSSNNDQATLQFPNGLPSTTFITNAIFYWGSKTVPSTFNGYSLYSNDSALTLTIATSVGGPAIASSMYSSSTQNATVTGAFYPGVAYYVTINVGNSLSCAGWYTMQPSDLGVQTNWISCCPTQTYGNKTYASNVSACPTCGWSSTNIYNAHSVGATTNCP